MFNKKSDYALNKIDREAIVYIDAEGCVTRLTHESFASMEEFLAWKEWSDANYHLSEKGSHVYCNHTASQKLLLELADPSLPARMMKLTLSAAGMSRDAPRLWMFLDIP